MSKSKTETKAGGGGGADASHGHNYHRIVAMLFILRLKIARDNDKSFEYSIQFEKKGYGKFDDIVIKYKLNEIWFEICIQCKHSSNKTTISATELFKTKNNKLALQNYISSFKFIINLKTDTEAVMTNFLLLSNRTIDIGSSYDSFTIAENTFKEEKLCEKVLSASVFKFTDDSIENNNLLSLLVDEDKEISNTDAANFLKHFGFVPSKDTNDMKLEIIDILKQLRKNDVYEANILYNSLYTFTNEKMSQSTSISHVQIEKLFVQSKPKTPSLYFKIRDPNHLFTGRKIQLEIMHSALQEKKTDFIIDATITGSSGIGKSQLVLEFIRQYRNEFKNIIWIHAESYESTKDSFVQLALRCKLLDIGEKVLNIRELIDNVYKVLSETGKSLFVFDDADHYNSDEVNNGIFDFLPTNTLNDKLFFIATSQNRDWKSKQTIDLKVFNETESCELLSRTDIKKIATDNELNLLCKILGNLPIALQTAIAYILQHHEINKMFGLSYTVSSFIKELDLKCKNVLHFSCDTSKKVLAAIWDKAILSILKYEIGSLAFLVLSVCCYYDSEGIPIKLFNSLVNNDACQLYKVIKLLSNYSLVDIQNDKIFIHDLLKIVVIEKIKPESRVKIVDCGFRTLLKSNPIKYEEIQIQLKISIKFMLRTLKDMYNELSLHLLNRISYFCNITGEVEQVITIYDALIASQMKIFGTSSIIAIKSKIFKLAQQCFSEYFHLGYLSEIENLKAEIITNNISIPTEFEFIFEEIKALVMLHNGMVNESKEIMFRRFQCFQKSQNPIGVFSLLPLFFHHFATTKLLFISKEEFSSIKTLLLKIPKTNNVMYVKVEIFLVHYYKITKKYDKALLKVDNLIKYLIECYGLTQRYTIQCLIYKAEILIIIGNKESACKILLQARKLLFAKEPKICVMELIFNLSLQYYNMKDFKKVNIILEVIIDFFKRNKNENNICYVNSLNVMFLSYKGQGLYSKAYEISRKVYTLLIRFDELKIILTLEFLLNFVDTMYQLKYFEEIVLTVKQSFYDLKRIYGLKNSLVKDIVAIYGQSLLILGKYKEGINTLLEMLTTLEAENCVEAENNTIKTCYELSFHGIFMLKRHVNLIKTIANVD